VTDNLLVAAKNIGDEVDLHNNMLDGVEDNIDHTTNKLEKTTNRVTVLIYQSSDSCLIICVCLLIAVLLVLIFAI
jgi:hypothetical protein